MISAGGLRLGSLLRWALAETEPQLRPTPPPSAHKPIVPRSVEEWLANKPAGSMREGER